MVVSRARQGRRVRAGAGAVFGVGLGLLTGCGGDQFVRVGPGESGPAPGVSGVRFGGRVLAGGQAVSGAQVQLFAAGTTGAGQGSLALLGTPVQTGSDGSFSVPAGSYTCATAQTQVLLVARGGRPAQATAENSTLAEVTALGACGSLVSGAAFPVTEATTAAAAWSLAAFLTPDGGFGASATNETGLANAVSTAQALADPSTGVAPGRGFPATAQVPVRKLNALANLLAGCTTGGGATVCAELLSTVAGGSGRLAADTLAAAVLLARSSSSVQAAVGGLVAQTPVLFSPAMRTAPADWTLAVTYTGGGMVAPVQGGADGPTALGVDAGGRVWVASHAGVVSLLSPLGVPVLPNGITGGGLQDIYGLALDASGNAWVANTSSVANGGFGSVTKIAPDGSFLSGATGFTGGGLNKPYGVAVAQNGSVWITNNGNARVTVLSSSGAPVSGSAGYGAPSLAFPAGIALDDAQNAWIGNQTGSEVTRLSASGTGAQAVSCCNGAATLAVDGSGSVWAANFFGDSVSRVAAGTAIAAGPPLLARSLSRPAGLAVDGSGAVWLTNFAGSGLTELAGAGAAAPGQELSPAQGWAADAALAQPVGIAVDASGNLWVANYAGGSVTEVIGAAAPVKTPLLGPVQQP